ncbi:MAG: DUF3786 domain-containing protein [Deltaproteobacteria bacterium]
MACAAPNQLHWEDLRNHAAEEIIAREGVQLDAEGRRYEVSFLGSRYLIDPSEESIIELSPNPARELTEEFQILLIRYLVAPNAGPVEGREISEKDLPGGPTFFQGPHSLQVAPIAKRFGHDPDAFATRGSELGGVPVGHGDKAVRFHPFPQIPVTYVLWRSDDEFPASVSVLFDASIGRWFALDMIFTLVWVLTDRILEDAGPRGSG